MTSPRSRATRSSRAAASSASSCAPRLSNGSARFGISPSRASRNAARRSSAIGTFFGDPDRRVEQDGRRLQLRAVARTSGRSDASSGAIDASASDEPEVTHADRERSAAREAGVRVERRVGEHRHGEPEARAAERERGHREPDARRRQERQRDEPGREQPGAAADRGDPRQAARERPRSERAGGQHADDQCARRSASTARR